MNKELRSQADFLYLLLAGLFVASLVTCNLIANKWVEVPREWLGFAADDPFMLSAGVLPYPLTFLVTDILSEFYGRKKTNRVVLVGFFASLLTLGILLLGDYFPAFDASPLSDDGYSKAFGNSGRIIAASMTAYLVAQFIDVRIFHYWKKLTDGKYLWLRNNASTIFSQLVDTTLVVLVLFVGDQSADSMIGLILHGWFYKALCALVDTPIIYGVAWIIRKKFKLKPAQEFSY